MTAVAPNGTVGAFTAGVGARRSRVGAADRKESAAHRKESAAHREESAADRQESAAHREESAADRQKSAAHREESAAHREESAAHREESATERHVRAAGQRMFDGFCSVARGGRDVAMHAGAAGDARGRACASDSCVQKPGLPTGTSNCRAKRSTVRARAGRPCIDRLLRTPSSTALRRRQSRA